VRVGSEYMISTYGKSKKDIEAMRKSGRVCAVILSQLIDSVSPGITSLEIDEKARELIEANDVDPAFLGYGGFPAVLCASVNDVAVHGVPASARLVAGDIIGLDFGVIADGWYSDSAVTVGVGSISPAAKRLIAAANEALRRGILQAKIGNRIGDISAAIQAYVEREGFSVVRDLVGHGVGRELHEPPQVPNFGAANSGEKITDGLVIAIEPIISAGSWKVRLAADGFGYETIDGSLVAHFEHTVAVTSAGTEILTVG